MPTPPNTARPRFGSLASLLIVAGLASPSLADGAAQAEPHPVHSQRYRVQVGEQRRAVLQIHESWAKKLDRNRDRVVTMSEIAPMTKKLPGNLRVDLEDYSLGVAQELAGLPSAYRDAYPGVDEIQARISDLQRSHPDWITLIPLGLTPQGHTLQAVRIRPPRAVDDQLPKLAIIAQQHAREWSAHQAALVTIDALLTHSANSDLLESLEFWIVPLANPDGYEYSRTVDAMWRKNRGSTTRPESLGVDLNRNFPFDFRRQDDTIESTDDDRGASDWPDSALYRGAAAASESETRDLMGVLDLPGMVGVIDLHGFGCKVVLPNEGSKVGDDTYQEVAADMLAALGTDYEVIRYRELYPVTGNLTDYADQRGLVAMTLEIGTSFQPHPSKMETTARTATNGILAFARSVRALGYTHR